MAKANPVGSFMRSYGLKIFYCFVTPFFVCVWNIIATPDYTHVPSPPVFGIYQTIWIWCLRIGGIILFIPSLAFGATYLFANFPEVTEGPDTDLSPGTIDPKIKNGPSSKKGHLACFIIRIITRGDYPELIRRNVAYHIDLMERYCTCDKLEAHVVTENRLDGDYRVGKTGQVRELIVPTNYKSKNGAMAKARNMAYWVDNFQWDPSYPSPDKTWILTLDEDSFITDGFVKEFFDKFLPSGADCSVSPTLLELPRTAGIGNACEESFFVTLQAMGMWLEGKILKRTPLWFRGAAYVVRRDVDKKIGHDYTPELSITEDHVFGHYFADSEYKIGYINGWNWEGGAPDLLGHIKQRGRWFRGHMYAFLYQKMSTERRMWCLARFLLFYIANGTCMVCALIFTVFIFSGNAWSIVPAAPQRWPMDLVVPFAFVNYFFSNIYGAWHIMSTKRAAFVTLFTCCWLGIATTFAVHLTELVWTLVTLADDFLRKKRRYEVTEKKEK